MYVHDSLAQYERINHVKNAIAKCQLGTNVSAIYHCDDYSTIHWARKKDGIVHISIVNNLSIVSYTATNSKMLRQ